MKPAGLPILAYHALDNSNAVTATDPSWFAQTIERLVHAGFTAIDLPSWVARGCPQVEKSFAVTFDDGLQSILAGVDVLARLHIPTTIFLVTSHIGGWNDWPGQPRAIPRVRMLDWSEIRSLSRRGFSLGAHTVSHPSLDALEITDVARELRTSRTRIESETNQACPLFAYPYGRSTEIVRHCAGRQFEAAFGTRLDVAGTTSDLLNLPRIDAYYLKSSRMIDRLITGRLEPWLGVRRGLRTVREAGRALIPSRV